MDHKEWKLKASCLSSCHHSCSMGRMTLHGAEGFGFWIPSCCFDPGYPLKDPALCQLCCGPCGNDLLAPLSSFKNKHPCSVQSCSGLHSHLGFYLCRWFFLLFKVHVQVNFLFLLLQMDAVLSMDTLCFWTPPGQPLVKIHSSSGQGPAAGFGCLFFSLQVEQNPAQAVRKAFFPVCRSLCKPVAVSWEPRGIISSGEEMGAES